RGGRVFDPQQFNSDSLLYPVRLPFRFASRPKLENRQKAIGLITCLCRTCLHYHCNCAFRASTSGNEGSPYICYPSGRSECDLRGNRRSPIYSSQKKIVMIAPMLSKATDQVPSG